VQVIGSWSGRFAASFSLQVEAAGNTSVHRGRVEDDDVVDRLFSALTVAIDQSGTFRASLRVEPTDQPVYELKAS
jgi:hypothetical protein